MRRHYYLLLILVHGAPVDEQCNIKRILEHSCLPNHMDINLRQDASRCLEDNDEFEYRIYLKQGNQTCPVSDASPLTALINNQAVIGYDSDCVAISDTTIDAELIIQKIELNPSNSNLQNVVVNQYQAKLSCEMGEFSISNEYSFQYNKNDEHCDEDENCTRRNVIFTGASVQLFKHVGEQWKNNEKVRAIINLGTELLAPFRPLVKKCTLGDNEEIDEVTVIDKFTDPLEEVFGAALGVLVASTTDGDVVMLFNYNTVSVPLVCDVTFKNIRLQDGNLTVQ